MQILVLVSNKFLPVPFYYIGAGTVDAQAYELANICVFLLNRVFFKENINF